MEDTSENVQDARLVFTAGSDHYELPIHKPFVEITIPSGSYHYALFTSVSEEKGAPDQEGTLTCRKYRSYTLTLFDMPSGETRRKNIGDEN